MGILTDDWQSVKEKRVNSLKSITEVLASLRDKGSVGAQSRPTAHMIRMVMDRRDGLLVSVCCSSMRP